MIVVALFFWWIIRFLGWAFEGPRYRRRKMRRDWNKYQRFVREDAKRRYEERMFMQGQRRGW
jgi:hypothetical protein